MKKFFDLRRAIFVKDKNVRIITDIKFKDNHITIFYLQAYTSCGGVHATGGMFNCKIGFATHAFERNFGTRLI